MTAFAVWTVICWARFELAMLWHGKHARLAIINKSVPRWARRNLQFFGVTVEAHGRYADQGQIYPGRDEQGVGRVFIANHSSAYDIPILFTVADTRVISRHDLATWPLIGRSSGRIGTLFVDRASRRSGASVLKEVDQALQRGEGVAMFPEGTSHVGDRVHEFRPGAFNAARRAGGEIIPIGLAYGDDDAYYGREPFMTHVKCIAQLPRLRVAVEIGDPIQVGQRSSVEMKEEAREMIQCLVDRARARLNA